MLNLTCLIVCSGSFGKIGTPVLSEIMGLISECPRDSEADVIMTRIGIGFGADGWTQ